MIDSDDNLYLTVNPLIEINDITTGWNNITLRKVSVKPQVFGKTYMDNDLVEDKHYHFNERKTTLVNFYSTSLNKIHLNNDGNRKTSKIIYIVLKARNLKK